MDCVFFFFFQAEDGIRELVRSRGIGDVNKRQVLANVGLASAYYSFVSRDTLWAQLAGILVVFVWNYAASSRFVWNTP